MITKEMIIESFSEFTGLEERTIKEYMTNGDIVSKENWNRLEKNLERDKLHYNSIPVICSYINWHYNIAFGRRRELAEKLNGDVLNYSCGIATECLLNGNKEGVKIHLLEYAPMVKLFIKYVIAKYNIRNITFPDTLINYDVVILTDVLEHLIDPKMTLSYCIGLLKPGGKILIRAPFNLEAPGHLSENKHLTVENLMAELNFTRYEVVEV